MVEFLNHFFYGVSRGEQCGILLFFFIFPTVQNPSVQEINKRRRQKIVPKCHWTNNIFTRQEQLVYHQNIWGPIPIQSSDRISLF